LLNLLLNLLRLLLTQPHLVYSSGRRRRKKRPQLLKKLPLLLLLKEKLLQLAYSGGRKKRKRRKKKLLQLKFQLPSQHLKKSLKLCSGGERIRKKK
jgi:hypothetical protein